MPLLVMPPVKVETPPKRLPTTMPLLAAEILPALVMPPPKVGPVIEMAVAAEVILLALSRVMPPAMMPLSKIEPVIVPLKSEMPPERDGAGVGDVAGEAGVAHSDTGDMAAINEAAVNGRCSAPPDAVKISSTSSRHKPPSR